MSKCAIHLKKLVYITLRKKRNLTLTLSRPWAVTVFVFLVTSDEQNNYNLLHFPPTYI